MIRRVVVSARSNRSRTSIDARRGRLGDARNLLRKVEAESSREQELGDLVVEIVGDPVTLGRTRRICQLPLVALGGTRERDELRQP